jgi:phage-related protein
MATANKMGALMQGSGIGIEESMDLSTKAMQRAADVASIMGIDLNSAMESVAGAAKGNFTMMDNLGVAMNATTIGAYALSKGIETSYAEMDNATKVGLAMEMFLEKTAYAEGNYAKENKTFAGSFNTLKASIENFLSGAGDVDAVIDSVMNFGEILIEAIGNMAPKMVEGIIKLLNGVIPQLPTLLQNLLPVVIQGAVDLINGLVASLPTLIPVLLNGIVMAFTQIVNVLPDILKQLIEASIFIINSLADQMPVLIPQIIDAILEMIPILIDNLPLFIKAGYQLLTGIAVGLINAVPSLINKLPGIIGKIIDYWRKLPSMMIDIGKNVVKGIWNGITNAKDWLLDKIKGFAKGVVDKVKSLFGIHSPSTVMRDEVGKYLAEGLGVGFDDELDNVYKDMQRAIDVEQGKLVASVETGRVFNTIQNSTPVAISINGDVNMDSQKVGRLVTPTVTRTIKNGGGV